MAAPAQHVQSKAAAIFRMTNQYKKVSADLPKAKIVFADTDRVEGHREIACDFMAQIFRLMPGDYAITDESELRDFTHLDTDRAKQLWGQIQQKYGITLADVDSERLADIFDAIALRQRID